MNARDAETIRREDARAKASGLIGADGYREGSASGHRAMVQAPDKRRKCSCGCGGRMTHIGLGDGLGMMGGCELSVRRWVRDGYTGTDR